MKEIRKEECQSSLVILHTLLAGAQLQNLDDEVTQAMVMDLSRLQEHYFCKEEMDYINDQVYEKNDWGIKEELIRLAKYGAE